jgi:hypothetical protein
MSGPDNSLALCWRQGNPPESKGLGNFLGIRIGLVTGDSAFFLLSDAERSAFSLAADELTKVLPRFHFSQQKRWLGIRGYEPEWTFELGSSDLYQFARPNQRPSPKQQKAPFLGPTYC